MVKNQLVDNSDDDINAAISSSIYSNIAHDINIAAETANIDVAVGEEKELKSRNDEWEEE